MNPPTWCDSIEMPKIVAMLADPKHFSTSPTVGGTVDRELKPMTTANNSTTVPVLGANRKTSTAIARAVNQRQQGLHAPVAHRPTHQNAADDVEPRNRS